VVFPSAPLQLLVTNIDFDEHKGRIAIGRVTSGTIRKAQQVGHKG
jgi:GTP-binding protein